MKYNLDVFLSYLKANQLSFYINLHFQEEHIQYQAVSLRTSILIALFK